MNAEETTAGFCSLKTILVILRYIAMNSQLSTSCTVGLLCYATSPSLPFPSPKPFNLLMQSHTKKLEETTFLPLLAVCINGLDNMTNGRECTIYRAQIASFANQHNNQSNEFYPAAPTPLIKIT